MPHQCVKCGTLYDDGDSQILKGCTCGARLFFYIRENQLEKARQRIEKLTPAERKKIEKDVLDLVGEKKEKEAPVVLDFESINVLKPGKYELDLVNLFKKQPLIYKLEDGKYVIDIAETFQRMKQ